MTRPVAPVQPIVSRDLWHLYAGPSAIERAAAGWAAVAASAVRTAETVDAQADRLTPPEWVGETSEVYHRHRRRLTDDTGEAGTIAIRIGDTLTTIASVLRARATTTSPADPVTTTSTAELATTRCPAVPATT